MRVILYYKKIGIMLLIYNEDNKEKMEQIEKKKTLNI